MRLKMVNQKIDNVFKVVNKVLPFAGAAVISLVGLPVLQACFGV